MLDHPLIERSEPPSSEELIRARPHVAEKINMRHRAVFQRVLPRHHLKPNILPIQRAQSAYELAYRHNDNKPDGYVFQSEHAFFT